eukprot:scaffold8383_cov129-Isochrysis_galbana.AAC.4
MGGRARRPLHWDATPRAHGRRSPPRRNPASRMADGLFVNQQRIRAAMSHPTRTTRQRLRVQWARASRCGGAAGRRRRYGCVSPGWRGARCAGWRRARHGTGWSYGGGGAGWFGTSGSAGCVGG